MKPSMLVLPNMIGNYSGIHSYPRILFIQNTCIFLITGKAIAKPGNLSQPIETRDSRDFGIAIDNLYENLKNSYLRAFSDYVKDLLRVYDCLLDGIERHPAFGPFERLMSNLYEPIYPYNLPSSILTLSMLLRLKGNDAIMYEI